MKKKRDKISGVYKVKNILTSETYIGSSTDVYDRLEKYKFNNAITKNIKENITDFGIENFEFDVMCQFKENEIEKQLLLDFEDYYILHFVKELGEDKILNSYTNDKRWISKKYKHYQSLMNKLNNVKIVKPRKISKGWKLSDEIKLNMSKNSFYRGKFGKDNPTSKAVNQLALDGSFIKRWDSMIELDRLYNKNIHSHISKCCKGERKSCYGFRWEFSKN